jgi:hypothetical protein
MPLENTVRKDKDGSEYCLPTEKEEQRYRSKLLAACLPARLEYWKQKLRYLCLCQISEHWGWCIVEEAKYKELFDEFMASSMESAELLSPSN